MTESKMWGQSFMPVQNTWLCFSGQTFRSAPTFSYLQGLGKLITKLDYGGV